MSAFMTATEEIALLADDCSYRLLRGSHSNLTRHA